MKIITFVVLVIVGTIIAGLGGDMRTPITRPGFDNIPTIIELDTTETLVIDEADETTLCEVTIPRNTLGLTDRVVRMRIQYIALNDSGGAKSIVWRVYYGSSAALVLPADTWATNVIPRQGQFTAWLINMGAVDDQQIAGKDDGERFINNYDRIAQPSNKDLKLKVTVDFSAADADLMIRNLICITTQMAP